MAANKGIQLDIDCDDSLIWFFDPDMVGIAISNILGNSIRYSKTEVLVTVKTDDGRLVLQIDDDGDGYPENMLNEPESFVKRINYCTGSTGLGLFFSATVAQHHERSGKQGEICLQNKKLLDGGCFQIYLP